MKTHINLIKQIVPQKDRVAVAVSMGVDSLAAYFFLKNRGYGVFPIHFNHKLREQNDVMEKKFLELNISGSKIGCFNGNGGTESDFREARFDFFRKVCEETGCKYVITAHHLDDCVESYLLNCFRGHPEYKPMSLATKFDGFSVLHPFLLTEKQDFIDYVQKYDLARYVVADETNDVIKGSRRNWVRNVIIPEMESQKLSLKKYCKRLINSELEKFQVEF